MKAVLVVILLILGVLLIGILTVGLTVAAATGIGWILVRFLPFSLYEATLLSLIGLGAPLFLGWQFLKAVNAVSITKESEREDKDEWEDEEEEAEEEKFIPSIPRWRQPLKRADRFANTRPDDRCPCGSGRKYKNCHGHGKV